jgi:hypothetical protein
LHYDSSQFDKTIFRFIDEFFAGLEKILSRLCRTIRESTYDNYRYERGVEYPVEISLHCSTKAKREMIGALATAKDELLILLNMNEVYLKRHCEENSATEGAEFDEAISGR